MLKDSTSILSSMLDFVQDAAVLALERRASGLSLTHKGHGFGQALTDADEAISAMMRERFGARLIEEETADAIPFTDARAMLADANTWTFIGDPIDGTAPFAGGLAGWGTMIAACSGGWPRAAALILPALVDERDRFDTPIPPAQQRGLLLAASEGAAYSAPTLGGRQTRQLKPLEGRDRSTGHVGWLPIASQHYTIDYRQGFFPQSESGYIADVAALAIGRSDATTFNHKLWDLAPSLPVLEALGFRLFRWPDLGAPPSNIADLFDGHYTCHPDLWLICRSPAQAAALAKAITRVL